MTEFSEADVARYMTALDDEDEGVAAFRDFVLEELNQVLAKLEAQRVELAEIRREMGA